MGAANKKSSSSSSSRSSNGTMNGGAHHVVVATRSTNPYHHTFSLRLLLASFGWASIFAFVVGRAVRQRLLNDFQQRWTEASDARAKLQSASAPPPVKDSWIAGGSAVSSRPDDKKTPRVGSTDSYIAQSELKKRHNYSGPGQQLLMDIENVDGDFLNSEEMLVEAMMNLIDKSGQKCLSHHCHGMEPMGVSCVGILLDGHVTFHTWPAQGVITLDLVSFGQDSNLQSTVETTKRIFGKKRTSSSSDLVEAPHALWALKHRGFSLDSDAKNPEDIDLDEYLLGWVEFEMKEEVASVETDFQVIEIFDVINPRFRSLKSYKRSLSNDGSYEAQNPDLFRPDRVMYSDKIMQSRLYGEKEYHEALVHPGMFAHVNPRRVAIIGGGEGATLREVLKHKSVENVTMVEIDKEMVDISRRFLPEWSSCDDFGSGELKSCFDDPRATVLYEDAIAWFLNSFNTNSTIDNSMRFDVVIMDALDPSSVVEFSDVLYNNAGFIAALANAITDKGVLVAQVGQASFLRNAPREYTRQGDLDEGFISHLEKFGFEKIKEYAEGHGGLLGVWDFLVAFKDSWSAERWFANEAVIDLEVQKRIFSSSTADRRSALNFFDGALMNSYAYPSRITEEVFCRKTPIPPLCAFGHGFDPEKLNAPISSFEVRNSSIAGAGRGVFFKEAYPIDTYLGIEESVHDMLILPQTKRIIKTIETGDSLSTKWHALSTYIFAYGFASDFYGDGCYMVDPGILTFINHGCNGTEKIGPVLSVTESTADPDIMPPDLYEDVVESAVYNPFIDRNHLIHITAHDMTSRDVNAGEELTDNYLKYLHDDNWKWGVQHYRSMCAGAKGVVTEYEVSSLNEHFKAVY